MSSHGAVLCRLFAVLMACVPACLRGCRRRRGAAARRRRASNRRPGLSTFTDIAARAGLRDPVVYGGIDRKRFIIETNGSGVALVDYDNDGWLDALTLSGTRLQRRHEGRSAVRRRALRRPTGCTGTCATGPFRM